MAYSKNILPRSAAYYSLNRARISGSDLILEAGGYAEIAISHQMLPKLTSKMLAVIHPSIFSDYYTNEAVQVYISIILTDGRHIDYLISASETSSGVFNTELELPEEEFASFTYRIFSPIPAIVYNWELCTEEAVDLTTVIEGVEQELPRLLYDYNTYSYAVAQKEMTVGLISCYLLAATDLQGHFTLSFFATERCNVHVRIKDNGDTELFTPQVYTVEKGYASISIPHAYLKKQATDHTFSVTVQCTNGQLSIPVRGLLYTIDGGYLATRLLDAGVDIEDISIRQIPTDPSPSEIWAIGFEGNRLLLKKREYSQSQKADWLAVKDFGEGIGAGVEFYGAWVRRNNADRFTLETDDIPYVFIIDLSGNLMVYSDEEFKNIQQLDTNVSQVSVCQGFSYNQNNDQGLVCTYIKDGNVYYCQLLYDINSESFLWHTGQALYGNGDAAFVSVHRLPDYRVGICVEHASGTKWYITARTYVGQAIKPELISALSDDIGVATVLDASRAPENILWTATQNEFSDKDTHHNGFVMTFDGPLIFLKGKTIDDLKKSLKVYINGSTTNAIDSITIVDNVLAVQLKNPVRGGSTVVIDYDFYYLFMRAYNGCYAFIQQEYTWSLPLPITLMSHSESVDVEVSTELNVAVKPLVTTTIEVLESPVVEIEPTLNLVVSKIIEHNVTVKEDLDVSLTNTLTLTVTQVGTTPI